MSGFIPLSVPNFGEKEAAYAAEAITSGWVSTSGAKVSEFEEALAAYVGMPRAVAANSGTSSLHLAAMAAGIHRGDEVIVPTLTFIAAVNPLTRYVGAEPIFIGCNDTLCIDPDAVEDFCANHCTLKEDGLYNNKTGARVRALGVVHVFGNMADMPRLLDIARRYKLILIEDATEALGTRYTAGPLAGKAAGTMGDIGCYSLDMVLNAIGYPKPLTVTGYTSSFFGRDPETYINCGHPEFAEEFGVDDFAAGFIRLEGGIILDFRISWAMNMDTPGDTLILGTKGGLRIPSTDCWNGSVGGPMKIYKTVAGAETDMTIPIINDGGGLFERKVKAFVDAIVTGGSSPIPSSQIVINQAIIDCIVRSARCGAEVTVDIPNIN